MSMEWTRSDGSVVVAMGEGHIDISVDGGDSWDALRVDEAREMATSLLACAAAIDSAYEDEGTSRS